MGNIAIRVSVHDEFHDIDFPLCEQDSSLRIGETKRRCTRKSIENRTQLFAIGPDLALVYCIDALAEGVHRFRSAENSSRSRSKCINDEIVAG